MKNSLMILPVCVIILAFSSPGVVRAADPSPQEATSFSNKDLEKYKRPTDDMPVTATDETIEKSRATTRQQQKEEMYWCHKGREYQKKIDRARDEVQDIEKLSSEENGGQAFTENRLKKPTRKKYEKAKKKLQEANRELQDIEEDAHGKDIPPGWLRCQFE